jgi:phosphodiester glycosidase
MVPTVVSFALAMSGPSNSSFTIRSFEWLRDHGAAPIASKIETFYYSINAPATGGPALKRLSLRGQGSVTAAHPPDIAPVITPALPGEGVWMRSESWSGTDAPLQITQLRSDPNYPRTVAGIAWIDTQRTRITLNPGILEPAVNLPSRGPTDVPASLRGRVLATFNSAFKLQDSRGGVALAGHTYAPMRAGVATFVGFTDGRVDIEAWNGGSSVPAGVAFARQNLPLIVINGHLNPHLSDGPLWGVTIGNAIRVWRSGIGVDAHGDLIYAAADNQTVGSLAEILQRAGAVRAMELDINSYWDSFITYAHPGAGQPVNLVPDMTRSPYRYLTPDDRDFFAVYLR